jgi:transmembrane sensor
MTAFDTPEDFLENDLFRDWVQAPNDDNSAYWIKWLEQNPGQRPHFELAVATMLTLKGKSIGAPDHYIEGKVADLQNKLAVADQSITRPLFRWFSIAASILVALGLAWIAYNQYPKGKTAMSPIAAEPSQNIKSITNTRNQSMLVNLPDGSSVVLSTGSTLEYEQTDGRFSREVRLLGEGFFEIAKDSTHPFFVFTQYLTARVLGTSFLVRSFENEPKAIVAVRTGSVSVTTTRNHKRMHADSALLLRKNEQANLVVATDKLTRESLPQNEPNAVPELLQGSKYVFQLRPVAEIFDLLENAYGIPIDYDSRKLKQCTLTASLADEPFLDKIRLICIGIEADYQILDSRVVISGGACGNLY